MPVMWWGSGGGHGEFKWTFYQDAAAGEKVLDTTVKKLIDFGFRAIVILAGHYPWSDIMDRVCAPIRDANPDVLLLWGIECTIGGENVRLPGDHAAKWETSYGLALLPDLVDMEALRPGRDASVWPKSGAPPAERQFKGVNFDPNDPLFAQYGEDGRNASASEAKKLLKGLEDALARRVEERLGR